MTPEVLWGKHLGQEPREWAAWSNYVLASNSRSLEQKCSACKATPDSEGNGTTLTPAPNTSLMHTYPHSNLLLHTLSPIHTHPHSHLFLPTNSLRCTFIITHNSYPFTHTHFHINTQLHSYPHTNHTHSYIQTHHIHTHNHSHRLSHMLTPKTLKHKLRDP